MEDSLKASKLKCIIGDISPINVPQQSFAAGHHGRGRRYHSLQNSPIFDPYVTPDSPNSPLIRYLRTGSTSSSGAGGSGLRTPLSSIENLTSRPPRSPVVFKTPVNIEEDVLVMDGILVRPKSNLSWMKSRLTSPNSGGRSSTSSSSSGGKENDYNSSVCKTDTCRSWEESGSCRFGAKCLFVHGKEELSTNSTSRSQSKNKVEGQICKAYSAGPCSYGTKCRFVHHQLKSTVPPPLLQVPPRIAMTLPTSPEIVLPFKCNQPSSSNSWNGDPTGLTTTDWSPLDDRIEFALPGSGSIQIKASREDVDSYIQSVLYGPASRRRLPVFAEFCPE